MRSHANQPVDTLKPSARPRLPALVRDDVPSAGARIVRNVCTLGMGQLFNWISTVGLAALLPRYLGDVQLGKLSLAFSFTQLFGLLATLGIGTYLTKEVARSGLGASPQVLNALLMRLPLALAAAGLTALTASLVGYDEVTKQLVYLYSVNIILAAIAGVLGGVLQGMQEMRVVAVSNAASKGALLGLVALFLLLGYGPVGVAIAWNLSSGLGLLGYLYAVLRRSALRGELDYRLWRTLLLGGLPFFVWEAALLIYGQIDVILLSILTHDAVIGWYGAAYRIISIPTFIPAIIMTAVFPALSSASGRDHRAFSAIANRALQVVVLATIPIALGIIILPDRLIETLGYPAEFARSIPLIVILALHIPLVGTDMIIGTALNGLDRQRPWALTGVAAALLNPALNLAFIPVTQAVYGNGAVGAAIVTVLTEAFMLGMGLWLLRGAVFDRTTLAFGLKCLLAGLVMVVVVWETRDLVLPLTVAIGALVYGAASLALGTISAQDIRLLRSYVLDRASVRLPATVEGAIQ